MIPASFAELNAITKSGPIIKPKTPNNFKPRNIAINVTRGESPICWPINFGSIVRLMASRIAASIES